MLTLRHFSVAASVLLLAIPGCNTDHPLEPPSLLVTAAQKASSGLSATALPGAVSLGWQDDSLDEGHQRY